MSWKLEIKEPKFQELVSLVHGSYFICEDRDVVYYRTRLFDDTSGDIATGVTAGGEIRHFPLTTRIAQVFPSRIDKDNSIIFTFK